VRHLSKSKLIAFRQCHKRLWLEVHRRELIQDSAQTESKFRVGNEVGLVAQRLYDPLGKGALIDAQAEGHESAMARTQLLLSSGNPIFEAGFAAEGALAYADVMLPMGKNGKRSWHMVEVKSSTSVKDYHRDDIAVQAYVARSAGVALKSIALAHIDSQWTYPGGDKYEGLLKENDLTKESFARHDEVKEWVAKAQKIVAKKQEPAIQTGSHCSDPFECSFLAYCRSQEPQPKHAISCLPNIRTNTLKSYIKDNEITELSEVPDELLNEIQQRVKTHTLSGKVYFDAEGAAADIAPYKLPATFLDFETVALAVPRWKGTRPYQQIPFQFSAHRLSRTEKLTHASFLDLSGNDPSLQFAKVLIEACGTSGPVFVYNASFEASRISELAKRYPKLSASLLSINARMFDLLKVASQRYYHPSQRGSWSIKKVLAAIAPELSHDNLEGVQDGTMAMDAYQEAITPMTTPDRKIEIERQLLAYCRLDTYAMVRLWAFFTGRPVPLD